MAKQILFTVTNAGKSLLASGVTLSHVVVGAGRYEVLGTEVGLKDEVARVSIISSGVEPISEVLRFSAIVNTDAQTTIHEVGILTSTGILFAVCATVNTPLFITNAMLDFVASFGLSLAGLASQNVSVDSGDNSHALSMMESHLQAANTHPQYLDLPHFQALLNTVIPIGYLYHSHHEVSPKLFFDELLGMSTVWRRVTGRIIVGTDPSDKFVQSSQFKLGQGGFTVRTQSQRPNAYLLQTTHVWERCDPDAVLYDGKHKYDGNANYHQ